MKKKQVFILSLLSLVLIGCSRNGGGSSWDTNDSSSGNDWLFGLEGNASEDEVSKKDSSEVQALLEEASNITKYSYETTVKIEGNESHFTDYFSPTAFYEDNDDPSKSFGYGEEKNTKAVFKYYLSQDKKEVNSSIYEYEGTSGDLKKLTGIYSSLSLANIGMLKTSMGEFSASFVSGNKYILTDMNTASIFQYMTTFGSSIINVINAVYINIINFDVTEFQVIVDCGSYGTIESIFKPIDGSSPTDVVEEGISAGTVKGVDSYTDVDQFLALASTNNYVLEGIKMHEVNGDTSPRYRIHLTPNYFYLEYLGEEAKQYDNYGYAFVKKGQTINVKTKQQDNSFKEETYGPLNYDAAFGFNRGQDGTFYFDLFKGPVEDGNQKYQEVSTLPNTGDTSILYIVPNKDTGEKEVYEWIKVDDKGTYGWSRYSSWYNNVGDFAINNASATFYLTGTSGLTKLGNHFFEKDLTKENSYYSKEVDVLSMLANGLFGWGFQPTTTWIEYVKTSFLDVTKDAAGNITAADLGLGVQASVNGGENKIQEIFYTYDFAQKGTVSEVEDFFKASGVQLA